MSIKTIKPLLPVTDDMTIRQAVEESIKIWIYLARTGDTEKHLHPKYDGIIQHYYLWCPLCQYLLINKKTCASCPLNIQVGNSCLDILSPYDQWSNATTILEKKRYAANITQALFAYYRKEWNETYNPYEE